MNIYERMQSLAGVTLEEGTLVRNKETGNEYEVKKPNPSKHEVVKQGSHRKKPAEQKSSGEEKPLRRTTNQENSEGLLQHFKSKYNTKFTKLKYDKDTEEGSIELGEIGEVKWGPESNDSGLRLNVGGLRFRRVPPADVPTIIKDVRAILDRYM